MAQSGRQDLNLLLLTPDRCATKLRYAPNSGVLYRRGWGHVNSECAGMKAPHRASGSQAGRRPEAACAGRSRRSCDRRHNGGPSAAVELGLIADPLRRSRSVDALGL